MKIRRLLENKRVVLASASPRRRELLKLLCEDFEICPASGEEVVTGDKRFSCAAEELSYAKCTETAEKFSDDAVIIACDTIVTIDGEILGKPRDARHAAEMLRILSARTHQVVSGVTVRVNGKFSWFSQKTNVTFRSLSDEDIEEYIATKEPFDKAGGYGIQGYGALLTEGIEGDYFNVVGLPVSMLAAELEKLLT